MELSIRKKQVVLLYNLGYRIINGIIYNPKNKIVKGTIKKIGKGYHSFHCPMVYVHHFVAYQKFKDQWLYSKLLVRHEDGNSLNNLEYNILLGTHQENNDDMSKEEQHAKIQKALKSTNRLVSLRAAHKRNRKIKEEKVILIRNMYNKGMRYFEISKELSIQKTTVWAIINNKIYKDVI